MKLFLGFLFGNAGALLIYWIAYLTVKGLMGSGRAPVWLILLKYLIYWKLVTFGFSRLPASSILIGFTAGIYLSFPILFWLNKNLGGTSQNQSLPAPNDNSPSCIEA